MAEVPKATTIWPQHSVHCRRFVLKILVNEFLNAGRVSKSRIENEELGLAICEFFQADDGHGVPCVGTLVTSYELANFMLPRR